MCSTKSIICSLKIPEAPYVILHKNCLHTSCHHETLLRQKPRANPTLIWAKSYTWLKGGAADQESVNVRASAELLAVGGSHWAAVQDAEILRHLGCNEKWRIKLHYLTELEVHNLSYYNLDLIAIKIALLYYLRWSLELTNQIDHMNFLFQPYIDCLQHWFKTFSFTRGSPSMGF